MHRDLKKLLHAATGESGFVVAIFLDVRGFSSFARFAESSEAAVFLRRMYTVILDEYFPNAAFFKPTGDGLLIILSYEAATLGEVANSAVRTSLDVLNSFPSFCTSDPMINFTVPQDLGIGLARGAATKLVSKGKTLDFSGRPLNLAARLMDLARPSGLVFDESFGPDLLGEDLVAQFAKDDVYIKGIAEKNPITVHFTAQTTVLPLTSKKPLGVVEWKVKKVRRTVKDLAASGEFRHPLEYLVTDPDKIKVRIRHDKVLPSGRKSDRFFTLVEFPFEFEEEPDSHYVNINYKELAEHLIDSGVKSTWPIEITIQYPTAPSD